MSANRNHLQRHSDHPLGDTDLSNVAKRHILYWCRSLGMTPRELFNMPLPELEVLMQQRIDSECGAAAGVNIDSGRMVHRHAPFSRDDVGSVYGRAPGQGSSIYSAQLSNGGGQVAALGQQNFSPICCLGGRGGHNITVLNVTINYDFGNGDVPNASAGHNPAPASEDTDGDGDDDAEGDGPSFEDSTGDFSTDERTDSEADYYEVGIYDNRAGGDDGAGYNIEPINEDDPMFGPMFTMEVGAGDANGYGDADEYVFDFENGNDAANADEIYMDEADDYVLEPYNDNDNIDDDYDLPSESVADAEPNPSAFVAPDAVVNAVSDVVVRAVAEAVAVAAHSNNQAAIASSSQANACNRHRNGNVAHPCNGAGIADGAGDANVAIGTPGSQDMGNLTLMQGGHIVQGYGGGNGGRQLSWVLVRAARQLLQLYGLTANDDAASSALH